MAPEPKKGKSNARMDAGKAAQLVEAIKKEQRCCAEGLKLASKLRHVWSSLPVNILKDHAQVPGGAGEGWADQATRGAQSGNNTETTGATSSSAGNCEGRPRGSHGPEDLQVRRISGFSQ